MSAVTNVFNRVSPYVALVSWYCIGFATLACCPETQPVPETICDAGSDTTDSGLDVCIETDHSVVTCLRAAGPIGFTASGQCSGVPGKLRANGVQYRPNRDGCVTLEFTSGTEPETVLCCP